MGKLETVLTNNRSNEAEYSRHLGFLLNEGWIIDSIEIDGDIKNGGWYYIHLSRRLEILNKKQ